MTNSAVAQVDKQISSLARFITWFNLSILVLLLLFWLLGYGLWQDRDQATVSKSMFESELNNPTIQRSIAHPSPYDIHTKSHGDGEPPVNLKGASNIQLQQVTSNLGSPLSNIQLEESTNTPEYVGDGKISLSKKAENGSPISVTNREWNSESILRLKPTQVLQTRTKPRTKSKIELTVATVPREPTSVEVSGNNPIPEKLGIYVQLGSFSSHERALFVVDDLRDSGFPVELSRTKVEGQQFYVVRDYSPKDMKAATRLKTIYDRWFSVDSLIRNGNTMKK